MAAAAWLRQRGVGHPLMTADPGMNPFAAGDMSVFATALAKLPMQVRFLALHFMEAVNTYSVLI